MGRPRCACHPPDTYGGDVECPKCGHWSFDPIADSCERRKCAYVQPKVSEAKVRDARQAAMAAALDGDEQDMDLRAEAMRIFDGLLENPEGVAEAIRRRDAAIDAIEASTSEVWQQAARQAFLDVSKRYEEFTVDAVWALLERRGIEPPHDNRAMSAPARWAVDAEHVADTGRRTKSTRPECHRREIKVYRSLNKGVQAA